MFRAIEIDVSKIHGIIHSDPLRFFGVEIEDKPDDKKQSAIADRMVHALRNDSFPSKSASMIRSATLSGEFYGAVGKHPTKNTATIRLINWRNIAYDLMSQGIGDALWVIEQSTADKDLIQSRVDKGIYDKAEASKLIKSREKKELPGPTAQDTKDSSVGDAGISGNPSGKDFDILDYWQIREGKKTRVITVADKSILLRDSDSPFDYHSHPFFGAPLINISGRSEGIGIGEATMSTQKTINLNRSHVLDLIEFALENKWLKLKGAKIKDKQLRRARDIVIETHDMHGLKHLVPDVSVVSFAIRFEEIMREEVKQASGAISGFQGPSREPTLGQAIIQRNESSSRHMIYAQQLAAGGGYERMLWLFWETLRKFSRNPLRVPSEMPGEFSQIAPPAIRGKVVFPIDITSPRRNPQARVAMLWDLLVKVSSVPALSALFDLKSIAARLVREMGLPNGEDILVKDMAQEKVGRAAGGSSLKAVLAAAKSRGLLPGSVGGNGDVPV